MQRVSSTLGYFYNFHCKIAETAERQSIGKDFILHKVISFSGNIGCESADPQMILGLNPESVVIDVFHKTKQRLELVLQVQYVPTTSRVKRLLCFFEKMKGFT